jgi:D-alanine-D-alanine ligase
METDMPDLPETTNAQSDDAERGNGRLKIGVLFGGRSGEHEISIRSAESVMRALDPERYDIVPVGITKEGWWMTGPDTLDIMKGVISDGVVRECILPADPSSGGLLLLTRDGDMRHEPIDVVFPVLHGTFGEDGTVQGLCELAGLPYVGAGVLGSAAGMDKVVQKQLFRQAGLPVVEFLACSAAAVAADPRPIRAEAERRLGYPMFVKPANLGSSVGISKAKDSASLLEALRAAAAFDRKIIIERAVPDAREIEVAVLGNDELIASQPGELFPSNEFYDYNAKYVDNATDLCIPAKLPPEEAGRIRDMALGAFRAVDCEGFARVDFLLSRSTGELVLNEINTIPGFTSISMYPKLMEAAGIPYPELLDRLIDLATRRHEEQQRLRRSVEPTAS